jgi:GT2 family glycosyltransferase
MGTLSQMGATVRQRIERRSSRTEPAVSVVINTLNRRDHLERTLVSLRDQSYRRFEVIVVDGPSTDGTGDLLDGFGSSIRRAQCDEARLGLSRNIGASMSAGEIVAYIDDDALPEPNWLERLVEGYSDDRIGAVGGPVFDVPLDRIDWRVCTCSRIGVPNTDTVGPLDAYVARGADPFLYLAGCNMSFRRTALRAIGGFNSLLAYGYDDVEVCCRLIDAGHHIAYASDALVHHDRASSAVRDANQTITDPYPLIVARATFALQCEYLTLSRDELVDGVATWAADWIAGADQHLSNGTLDQDSHHQFVKRALAAVSDGTMSGLSERPWTVLAERSPAALHRYR